MPDHQPNMHSEIVQDDEIAPEIMPASLPDSDDAIATAAELEEKLIHAEAKAAILSAGGNVTLLLMHVASSLRLSRDGDELRVRAALGEDEVSPQEYVAHLKQDPDYAAAFGHKDHRVNDASSSVSGSGASIIPGSNPTVLDPDNPLKLGSALADIARGSIRVRF